MTHITYPLTLIEPITGLGACCEPDEHGRCVTCSDDAQRAMVVSVMDGGLSALVEINGEQSEIDISLVDDVAEGQVLLAHGGVALEKLTAER